jgi:peptidylprolyl isomerase
VTNHKDYYAVLDINPHADGRAIADAYERLSREYQPDDTAPPVNPEGMREIDEAFDILDDPERRAEYDLARNQHLATVDVADEPSTGWAPIAVQPAVIRRPLRDFVAPGLLALGALAALAGFVLLAFVAFTDNESTVVLASGLRYTDTAEGSGELPHPGDVLTAHYTGTLEDGTEFDSSRDGPPLRFPLVPGSGAFIQGWEEGLATMKEGGKRKLIIPPELAYGPEGTGDGTIPPNATVIFDVELLDIESIGQEFQTASGLRYVDLDANPALAMSPKPGEQVEVHYRGTLPDGTTFVDTSTQGQRYVFVLGSGSETRGFEEGVSTMKVGDLRRLTVPPELGYGDQEKEVPQTGVKIPPNTTLTYEVRLFSVGQQSPPAQ